MGNERLINRSMILAAAMEMADEGGMETVTMRSLATRLGVTPMALYWHVPSRPALVSQLADVVLHEIAEGAGPAHGQEGVRGVMRSFRQVARRHPEGFGLLLRPRGETPMSAVVQNRWFEALMASGVSFGDAIPLARFINTVVLGWAAAERAGWMPFSTEQEADDGFDRIEQLVDGLIDQRIDERRRHGAAPVPPTAATAEEIRSGSTA